MEDRVVMREEGRRKGRYELDERDRFFINLLYINLKDVY